ncbi:hypothetical protein ABZV14_42920 [Streptosporangium canum]|uniref:hypothetical protein n=1 Tax=Streptosporangium canum TaxID=324952 RepID=UPI0033A048A8
MTRLHAMIAGQVGDDADPADVEVPVGIETDRGPWVQAPLAAGYPVPAVSPPQTARYRERLSVSGAQALRSGRRHQGKK